MGATNLKVWTLRSLPEREGQSDRCYWTLSLVAVPAKHCREPAGVQVPIWYDGNFHSSVQNFYFEMPFGRKEQAAISQAN